MLMNRNSYSMFLIHASLALWLYSVGTADLRVNQLGLISSLPITFFLAMAILTTSFILTLSTNTRSYVSLAHLILLILFLHLSPSLLEGTPRFVSVYTFHGDVDYVLRHGQTNPLLTYYQVWPGGVFLASALVGLAGIDGMTLLLLGPLLLQALQLAAVYYLLRQINLDGRAFWLAIWSFFLFDWVPDYVFLPQNIALRLYIFGLATLLILTLKFAPLGHNMPKQHIVILVLFFAAIVITHPFSTFAFLATVVLLTVLIGRKKLKLLGAVFSLAVGVTSLWYFYGIKDVFLDILKNYVISPPNPAIPVGDAIPVFRPQTMIQQVFQAVADSVIRNPVINVVRLGLGSLVLISMLLGLILLLMRGGYWRRVGLAVFAVLLAANSLILVTSWGGEIISRIFSHVLPLAVVPLSLLFSRRLRPFAIFLILIAPSLHFLANYGNEPVDYIPRSEIEIYEFLKGPYVPSRSQRIGGLSVTNFSWELATYRNIEDTGWNKLSYYLNMVRGEPRFEALGNHYILESKREIQVYSFLTPPLPLTEWFHVIRSTAGYDKVYTTGDYSVYNNIKQPF